MSSGSGSDSGSSGEVTADYYGPDSSLVDEVALTGGGGDTGAVTADYYGGGSTTSPTTSVSGSDIDSSYNASDAYFTPTQEQTFGDKVTDYITSGGLIGAGIRTVSDIFGTPENQYAGITGEDVYETPSQYAQDVLNVDYDTLDLENQRSIDQEYFDQGYRSSSFQELYDTGDVSNLQNLTQPESDAVKRLIPQASYVVGGQQPIESQVNKYFANIGNQSGLSSQLESDYNTAKANVAQTMAITPLAQQFGYSTQPYGALTAQNLGTNPFNIPYLQTRGLI
jgi:hypothetical protein